MNVAILQLTEIPELAFMWGDMGNGQIHCCPNHPNVVALTWACS